MQSSIDTDLHTLTSGIPLTLQRNLLSGSFQAHCYQICFVHRKDNCLCYLPDNSATRMQQRRSNKNVAVPKLASINAAFDRCLRLCGRGRRTEKRQPWCSRRQQCGFMGNAAATAPVFMPLQWEHSCTLAGRLGFKAQALSSLKQ